MFLMVNLGNSASEGWVHFSSGRPSVMEASRPPSSALNAPPRNSSSRWLCPRLNQARWRWSSPDDLVIDPVYYHFISLKADQLTKEVYAAAAPFACYSMFSTVDAKGRSELRSADFSGGDRECEAVPARSSKEGPSSRLHCGLCEYQRNMLN